MQVTFAEFVKRWRVQARDCLIYYWNGRWVTRCIKLWLHYPLPRTVVVNTDFAASMQLVTNEQVTCGQSCRQAGAQDRFNLF